MMCLGPGLTCAAHPCYTRFEEVGSTSAVKVAVLVRPLLEMEKQKSCKDILQVRHVLGRVAKPGCGFRRPVTSDRSIWMQDA